MPDFSTLLKELPPEMKAAATNAALGATAASVNRVEQSTPHMALITYAPLIGKIITIFAGGFLVKRGIDVNSWTGEQWELALGVAVFVGGAAWAWIGKIIQARREHQIALASAAASAAATQAANHQVQVAVQPPAANV